MEKKTTTNPRQHQKISWSSLVLSFDSLKKLNSIENQLYEPNSVTDSYTEGKK